MKPLRELRQRISQRLIEIEKEKRKGAKVVGYPLGGFFPEELALAAGTIPLGMVMGGDRRGVDLSAGYICRWLDTFWRSQIGTALSGDDPYFQLLDLLAVPITDNHVRAFSDLMVYYGKMNVFNFGVPHTKQATSSLDYYQSGITRLRLRLEELIGGRIGDEDLLKAVQLCNKERKLLRELSLSRKSKALSIRSNYFTALNHASFLLEKATMIDLLNQARNELNEPSMPKGPRILLTGSTLAMGDSKVQDLIEEAGGVVVIEDFAEGIKPYWTDVQEDGDLLHNIAECYFWKRKPPAWFRPDEERLNALVQLCRTFDVQGIVWYQLMFRESYKTESMYFPERIKKETGIPSLILESDYDAAETGQMITRVETFISTLSRRLSHD